MSALKLSSDSTLELEKYRKKVELNIKNQLIDLNGLILPELQSIVIDDVCNSIFEGTAESIRTSFDLPINNNQVIYIFKLGSEYDKSKSLEIRCKEIQNAIEKNEDRHTRITGINGLNFKYRLENPHEVVLYVGTSKSFASRLRDHIGHGSDDTAALCLKLWPIFQNKSAKLVLEYYNFGPNIESESLKLFEFFISQDLHPLMGRNRKA